MPIASVIDGIQRFIVMFAPVSIQSLGRDQCQKPMLFAGDSGGQCPPYIRDWLTRVFLRHPTPYL